MRRIAKTEFAEIVLSKKEQKIFKQFKEGNTIKMDRNEAYCISRFSLIEQNITYTNGKQDPWDGSFKISDFGQHYRLYQREILLEKAVVWAVAIWGAVTGTVALAIDIVRLFL